MVSRYVHMLDKIPSKFNQKGTILIHNLIWSLNSDRSRMYHHLEAGRTNSAEHALLCFTGSRSRVPGRSDQRDHRSRSDCRRTDRLASKSGQDFVYRVIRGRSSHPNRFGQRKLETRHPGARSVTWIAVSYDSAWFTGFLGFLKR